MKVSTVPKLGTDAMGSYAISPFGYQAGNKLRPSDEKRLAAWVALNLSVLEDYWDGNIAYTEDAIERLQPISDIG